MRSRCCLAALKEEIPKRFSSTKRRFVRLPLLLSLSFTLSLWRSQEVKKSRRRRRRAILNNVSSIKKWRDRETKEESSVFFQSQFFVFFFQVFWIGGWGETLFGLVLKRDREDDVTWANPLQCSPRYFKRAHTRTRDAISLSLSSLISVNALFASSHYYYYW